MSTLPTSEYVHSCKVIETFSSFFERVAIVSNDPERNIENLKNFKKVLYDNIDNKDKVKEFIESLSTNRSLNSSQSRHS